MSIFAAFIIGLLVGWVIEWILDWVYWRRKQPAVQPEALEQCRSRVTSLEQEIASYKSQLADLQADAARSARVPAPAVQAIEGPAVIEMRAAAPIAANDGLETLRGISAEIIQRLKQAGVDTVAKLAALMPKKLKEILGDLIPQPGGEVEIVKQARLASGMIQKVDDLEVIVGIGPVIARTLNQAGIFTFEELGALSADDLRAIVGKQIQQLADEENILSQARQLAEKQARGG